VISLLLRPLPLLALMALASLGSVAGALVAQYHFNMQPCPWCILQRVLFVLIGLVAAVGVLAPVALLRRLLGGLIGLLAVGGGAAALWQHFVAAKSASCDLTLADRIVSGLKLDATWPQLFEVRASCADAIASILGVSFDFWSLALFACLLLGGCWLAFGRNR